MVPSVQSPKMPTLLIVEDSPKDMRIATEAAMSVGFKFIQGNTSCNATITRLSRALECSSGLPDALLIDLDLGRESGFELLRFRHQTPAVYKLPAVVWTHLDSQNKELCELFHV